MRAERREAVDARQILAIRGMPWAPDMERLVLGSCVADGYDRVGLIRGTLDETHFHLESNRRIWAALVEMHEAGKTIDRVALAQHLKGVGKLDDVGGLAAIVSLDEGMPIGANIDGWIQVLIDKALRRTAIARLNAAMEACLRDDADALEAAQSVAAAISDARRDGAGLRTAGEVIESIGVQEFCRPTRAAHGVPLPPDWQDLRSLIPVLRPGQLVVVAALTSAGKSTFAAQIGLEAARAEYPVAMFSMEMGADEILPRLASVISGVDGYAHQYGRMNADESRAFREATATLADLPLMIDDRSTHTVTSIAAAVRRQRTHPKLVIVDYLQLMDSAAKYENRVQAVAEMSRGLKRLSGELQVPVIALSQLNRRSAQDDRRPELHDLRDSGSIEQDANVVIFLHIGKDNAMLSRSVCEVIVAKNRGGRKGTVSMVFDKPTARFIAA